MDPLLFGIDGETVVEVLGTIVLLALLIERALSILIEWRPVVAKIDGKGLKEPLAFIASVAVVSAYGFDALAIIFKHEQTSLWGFLITGAIVAGGSKGAIALFRDYLGWKSKALKELEDAKKAAAAGATTTTVTVQPRQIPPPTAVPLPPGQAPGQSQQPTG